MLLALLLAFHADLEYPTWESTVSSIRFVESGVRWRVQSVEGRKLGEHRDAVYLFRNGRKVATYLCDEGPNEPSQVVGGFSMGAARPKVLAPFPVVAIRGRNRHFQDTRFLGFKDGKAFQMGRSTGDGEVGGPINYGGRSDLWLFDDYLWYSHYNLKETTYPLHRLLYRIGKDGKLRFVRKWLAPVRRRLPDTVGLGW